MWEEHLPSSNDRSGQLYERAGEIVFWALLAQPDLSTLPSPACLLGAVFQLYYVCVSAYMCLCVPPVCLVPVQVRERC